MKQTRLLLLLLFLFSISVNAQRKMDSLDRGLVAVNMNNGSNQGNFVSWRILGEEYYDVTYNIYRDGTKLNSTPLTVSNYTDSGGSSSSSYTVSAVINGVEQAQCSAVTPWSSAYQRTTWGTTVHRTYAGYKDITLQNVYSRNGTDVTSSYSPNDAEVADLDGDGELEIIIKRRNTDDADALYVTMSDPAYDVFEAYKMDGTRLWWIDAGPNMVSGGSHEFNLIAYDWDLDGKAEIVLRGADDMIIHMSDGTTQTIGTSGVDTRSSVSHVANMTYTNTGNEYLIYMNGETGKPYQVMTYPLARGSASDWGDSYGHRSSKYFFGAPYLDGRKPSIFLARGIYTKIMMAAYDVDASSHSLTQKWTWSCSDSSSDWYGQGYHNYVVADVDWDGRDEIVYGSMVIDDNGLGLSTTGFGHGDAQHVGDFDPYRHGQEVFACNEDEPSMNYRDATTSDVYYRLEGTEDDGRALCGNFSNDYPGSLGRSTQSGMVSTVTDAVIDDATSLIDWSDLNFRIYWDGDLLDEILNSPGTEKEAKIDKPGSGRIFTSSGCNMNNSSKNHPCFSGDILGDWREEIIVRCGTNIRIYTTAIASDYGIYTLWHDMQYRQAMVWQMHAYNQPPHPSFFLGELEGITIAPPPVTNNGRTEISNGSTISSSYDDKHILLSETNNMTVAVSNGAAPYILTDNAPTWVQGSGSNSNITTTTYTHTLTGGAFTGDMRLVKQGDGILVLPDVTQTYTGETNVWAGTLRFDGKMQNSPVWLNRFAMLDSHGGTFSKGITAEYGAQVLPGGANNKGTLSTSSLTLNFGSRVKFDLYASGYAADNLNADTLTINTTDWENGPEYSKPVFQFVRHSSSMPDGVYFLGTIKNLNGSIDDITIEGLSGYTYKLRMIDTSLYLILGDTDYLVKTWTFNDDTWASAVSDKIAADGSVWNSYTSAYNAAGYHYDSATTEEELECSGSTLDETSDLYFTATSGLVSAETSQLDLTTRTSFTIKNLLADQQVIITCASSRGSYPSTLTATNTDISSSTTIGASSASYTYTVAADGDVTFTVGGYQYLKVYSIEVTKIGGNEEESTEVNGTICWSMNAGGTSQSATISDGLSSYISASISAGSNLSLSGTKTVDSITESLVGVSSKQTAASSDNGLSFVVTPASGYTFTITAIEFTATRFGTDGGNIDVSYDGNSLATGLRPNRNNATTPYTTYSYTVDDWSSSEAMTLLLNFYNLATNKNYGIANITLTGTLTNTESSAKAYNAATAIEEISAATGESSWYTLTGLRVSKQALVKGRLYIHNGKKVIYK